MLRQEGLTKDMGEVRIYLQEDWVTFWKTQIIFTVAIQLWAEYKLMK